MGIISVPAGGNNDRLGSFPSSHARLFTRLHRKSHGGRLVGGVRGLVRSHVDWFGKIAVGLLLT